MDKLEFGGLKARGILSPSGRHTHSEWWSCVSSETTRKRKKTIRAPTSGVGGRRRCINRLHRFLSPRPASGFRYLFGLYEWFRPPRCRVSRFTTRYGYVARFTGSEFRSLALANCPINSNLSGYSQCLGCVCVGGVFRKHRQRLVRMIPSPPRQNNPPPPILSWRRSNPFGGRISMRSGFSGR